MSEVLYTGLVDSSVFDQMLRNCQFAANALFMAEQLPTHVVVSERVRQNLLYFSDFSDKLMAEITISDYTSGRIFQDDGELRWEKQGSEQLRVIYLGSEQNTSIIVALRDYKIQQRDGIPEQQQTKSIFLFGQRLSVNELNKIGAVAREGDFAEVRIPRLLRYPTSATAARRLCLKVREYMNAATGQVELFRFQKLEAEGSKPL